MHSCIDGIGVSWPKRAAYSWSSEVPTWTSDPCVCFGCIWVRNTALERKWSPPISGSVNASALRTSVLLTMVMSSRKGSSGFRLDGPRSKSRPAAAGAHRCWVIPHGVLPAEPCTISMATSRTFFARRRLGRGARRRRHRVEERQGQRDAQPLEHRAARKMSCPC